jgi:hypothetical protein
MSNNERTVLSEPRRSNKRAITDCYFYNGTQRALTMLAGRAVRLNAKLYWAVNPTKLGLPKAALSTIRYDLAQAEAQAYLAYAAGILTVEARQRYVVMFGSVSLELEAIVKSRRTRYSQYLTPPSHHAELTALCDAMIQELDALIDAAYTPGQARSFVGVSALDPAPSDLQNEAIYPQPTGSWNLDRLRDDRDDGPPAERSGAGEEGAADRDPVTGAEYGTPT